MEFLSQNKSVKYLIFGLLGILLLAGLGLAANSVWREVREGQPISVPENNNQQTDEFPRETVVREREDGSVDITPSREDTIQIQDEEGNWVEVPAPNLSQ